MQPVRKKQQNQVAWRWISAILGLLVLSGGVYMLLRPAVPGKPFNNLEQQRVALIQKDAKDLLRVDIINSQGGTFSLLNGPEGLKVEGLPDFVVDKLEAELIVKDLTQMYANEIAGELEAGENELDLLGLGDGAPRATAAYADGSSLTMVFGHSAHTEIPSDYLIVLGSPVVYTVSPETRDHFDRALETLHAVPAINFNPDLVDGVEVLGQRPFTLSQVEGLWELTEPLLYPASSEAVRGLLSDIGNMRFALYAGEASGENLIKYGLAEPRRVITFMLADSLMTGYDSQGQETTTIEVPAQHLRIALGSDIENLGLYCLYEGKIYQASNASMGFLRDTVPDGLLSASPLNIPIARLNSLRVTAGGARREYQVTLAEKILPNNQLALDEAGNVLHEPYVSLNGVETDREAFFRQYLALMSLRRDGRLPEGYQPETLEPVKTYLFDTAQGARELALFPYGALHYAMRVNGVFVDYISRGSADQITL